MLHNPHKNILVLAENERSAEAILITLWNQD